MSYKENLKKSFRLGLEKYNINAEIQMNIAHSLVAILPEIEQPKVLEIGCGTGFLTEKLFKKYPKGQFDITDLCPTMVDYCKKKFYTKNTRFFEIDGEKIKSSNLFFKACKYDLIVTSMVLHWFENPLVTIKNLKHLGPIFYSTIGEKNFIEWQKILLELKLSNSIFPVYKIPGKLKEEFFPCEQVNLIRFFKSLKDTGTGLSGVNQSRISVKNCRQILKVFNTEAPKTMTWHIVYGVIN
ncbi:MAG: hypothetical protein CBC42_02020 [Betaproteobacteria bacterium TMED82]|nr:MAG: hypothetical protein CBC42_02020 [Betaproteobacteria bacterium TMED82]|tara:strand:+ start:10019 stop:10738 length:720 start_codon:yes stop_codon:yes gene_type:complete